MGSILRILNRFGLGRVIALFLLLDLTLLRIWDPLPIEALRLRSFDAYQLIEPRTATQRPVVIVDIDEPSLKALGQWPWPRTMLAELVDRLTKLGAAAIAFDMVLSEPDRTSPGTAAESFPGIDEALRAQLRELPSNDRVLADAVARSRVVLGQSGLPSAQVTEEETALPQTSVGVRGPVANPGLVSFPGLLRNVPLLEQAAAGRGLFSILPDRDGVVRRVPIMMKAGGTIVPSVAVETLRVALGSSGIVLNTDPAGLQNVVPARGLAIRTDGIGRLWVHFTHHDPARFVSAKDVLEGRVPADRFERRLVLLGTSAVGLLDLKTTPVDPAMPGVEIHAQLLESILSNKGLTSPAYATLAELALMILFSLALIALAPALGAWALLVAGTAFGTLIVGLSWYFYSHSQTLIDPSYPLGSTLAVYSALVFTNYVRAHAERRQIRSAFSQYLSPALVEQLAQSPEKLVLGGEQRQMTVMFSDVRGFTTIAELYKDDPRGLTALMNRLLSPLTNAIIEQKGTIDKYMGDAIMAFWNAPLDDPSHELNACRAALQMLERLAVLNDERRREAEQTSSVFIPMRIGVGLNTGPCVVGNMGSDLHFNYSVLGDTVNVASRLEAQSKTYGTPIVIGAATARAVQDELAVIELDRLQVKGKTEPETVFALLGRFDKPDRLSRFERLRDANAAMLQAYRSGDWQGCLEAIMLCREAARDFGLEELYDLYVARVRTLKESPPSSDWNGVWVAKSK